MTQELDIKSRYVLEFSQACLVDSSLIGVLRVRIMGWIWFLLDTSSHDIVSSESLVVVLTTPCSKFLP